MSPPKKLFKVLITQHCTLEQDLPKLKEIAEVVEWQGKGIMPQEEFIKRIHDYDAAFIFPYHTINKDLLDKAPKLKVVASLSVGFNHIDQEECKKRGVKVGFCPGVLTNAVAELGIAYLMAMSRRIPEGIIEAKTWVTTFNDFKMFWLAGREIKGSTVGIYGLGRIGECFLEKLIGLKPGRVIYNDVVDKKLSTAQWVPFDEFVAESDFIVITVMVTPETIGKFNKENLLKMKKDASLINISRGSIIKTDDLVEVMKSGHLGGAALDVTEPEPLPLGHPLFDLPNVLVMPHCGSCTWQTRAAMIELTEENIVKGLLGEDMPARLC